MTALASVHLPLVGPCLLQPTNRAQASWHLGIAPVSQTPAVLHALTAAVPTCHRPHPSAPLQVNVLPALTTKLKAVQAGCLPGVLQCLGPRS